MGFAAVLRQIQVKLVGVSIAVRQILFQRAELIAPFYAVFLCPTGLNGELADSACTKGQKKCQNTNSDRHSPHLLSSFYLVHRTFPPNSVPPNSRFISARTANRPRTKPIRRIAERIKTRFVVSVIKYLLDFLMRQVYRIIIDESIVSVKMRQSTRRCISP